MEELIGRVHEGLWLAASACPYGSSMPQLLRAICWYADSKGSLERGGEIDQCAADSIKPNQNQLLAHQVLVTVRRD